MSTSTRLAAILQAVMQGMPAALSDRHYPGWHLAPVTGLLNDPNGFIHFDGHYHLFYQWNPLGCAHQHKCWGHWRSADLLHWQHQPIALMPDEEYDRSGCYSGSAVEENGVLTLIYTGNVKFEDGSRTAWQCLAQQNSTGDSTNSARSLPCRRATPATSAILKCGGTKTTGTWFWRRRPRSGRAGCCYCVLTTCARGTLLAK